jgi:hypothetical protein
MDDKRFAELAARCATRQGALEAVREAMQLLSRPPGSLVALRELVELWDDPVAIDDAVEEAAADIDAAVEAGGSLAHERLSALRVATRARAEGRRQLRETRRARRA